MMRALKRWSVAVAVLSSALVFAQTDAPPPPPPPPPDVPAAAPAPAAPAAPAEEPYKMGVRVGGSLGLGAFIPGPQIYFQFFDLHGGVQVSQLFGAYLRVGRTGGFGLSLSANSGGASAGISLSGYWLLGANAELSLGDSFFLAAGPQVGFGGWLAAVAAAGTSGGGLTVVVANGTHPGLDFKLGLATGGSGSRVKRAHSGKFTIALDVSVLYATDLVQVDAQGNATGAKVAVNFSDALSIAPTLQIGYEFR